MKKSFFIINIIMFILTCVADVLYSTLAYGNTLAKGLVSLVFVLMGVFNLWFALKQKSSNIKFPIFMLVGLTLCLIADVVLNLKGMFMYGALIFAAGHVFYFVAYSFLSKVKLKDFIPAAIMFIPVCLLLTLYKGFNYGGIVMEIVCIFYGLIISCMVGKTISLLIEKRTLTNIMLVVGSVLFATSDVALLFHIFAESTIVTKVVCCGTYWPAQAILAFTIFTQVIKDKSKQN